MIRQILLFAMAVFLTAVATSNLTRIDAGVSTSTEPAATLGQAFMGPVGTSEAFTRVMITNRDLKTCQVRATLSRGSAIAPPIKINGELAEDNTATLMIPSGGVKALDFAATVLVQGIIAIFVDPPCTPDSVSVSGTYFLSSAMGLLQEAFSIPANRAGNWLTKDRCAAISANYDPVGENGIASNLGIATSSVVPGRSAPQDIFVTFIIFDATRLEKARKSFDLDGIHSPLFPLDQVSGLEAQMLTVVICLRTGEAEKDFKLDLTAVGTKGSPVDVQFENAIFADGFESGDTSAWTN